MAIFCRQFPIPPPAVREYEIQQLSFFGRRLSFEQYVRTLCQFQQFDTFLDIVPFSGLMSAEVAHDSTLFGPKLRRLPIKELRVDSAIEFVHVHRIDPILDASVLPLQPSDCFGMELFFVFVALPQRLRHPVQHFRTERDALQQSGETLLQHLFADVTLWAFPSIAGTVIVHIAAFLHLADQRASAVPTSDQAAKGEFMHSFLRTFVVPALKHVLYLLPEFD